MAAHTPGQQVFQPQMQSVANSFLNPNPYPVAMPPITPLNPPIHNPMSFPSIISPPALSPLDPWPSPIGLSYVPQMIPAYNPMIAPINPFMMPMPMMAQQTPTVVGAPPSIARNRATKVKPPTIVTSPPQPERETPVGFISAIVGPAPTPPEPVKTEKKTKNRTPRGTSNNHSSFTAKMEKAQSHDSIEPSFGEGFTSMVKCSSESSIRRGQRFRRRSTRAKENVSGNEPLHITALALELSDSQQALEQMENIKISMDPDEFPRGHPDTPEAPSKPPAPTFKKESPTRNIMDVSCLSTLAEVALGES